MEIQKLPCIKIEGFITKDNDLNIKIIQSEADYEKYGKLVQKNSVFVDFIIEKKDE